MIRVLSWNIRGALRKEAIDYLWFLVKNNNINIVFLLETHLMEEEAKVFKKERSRQWDGIAVASNGRAGGMILLWAKKKWKISLIHKDSQSINVLVQISNEKIFLLTGVYARIRSCLWKMLGELKITDIPWIVLGDMNVITDANEKRGGRAFHVSRAVEDQFVEEFTEFTNEAKLINVGYKGAKFTWTNNRKGQEKVMTRLDKVLFNSEWFDWDMEINVEHL
ncbi:hypothetical protein Cni_G22357 [Canna indica]|uniref:Endonuclease/exonuclease/phosphatase domain-containing protein n=1 Tax=Canna indica TaxID=4628 RepID=A0AAQ3KR57_9LILI|nr:hypothetical protein Cni_G22357 [Canna indica]